MFRFATLLLSLRLSTDVAHTALLSPIITPAGGMIRSPARVTITNVNGAGTIFYTLDGDDPRDPLGYVASSARVYCSPVSGQLKFQPPLSVNRSMVVRARVK